MTVLWIVLGVLAVLFLLLLFPVRLTVLFKEKLSLKLHVLLFLFTLYPKKQRVRIRDYSKKKLRGRRRKQKIKTQSEQKQKEKKPKSIKDALRTLRLLFSILKATYPKLLAVGHIRVHRLCVSVATDDAAKTALLYGAASQGTAYLLALLEESTRTTVGRDAVAVTADFCDTQSKIDVKITITATPLRLLWLALSACMAFLRAKGEDKEKNTNQNGGSKDERKQAG